MQELEKSLARDVERIQSLSIVPSILELICRVTGMGFSAVARVTEDKWIACAVKDEINFGLKPGGELKLETTICNEIRGHGQPVVIDEVAADDNFCNHHTPKMYGFQSYISIPILLKDGTFFGTLCAIDPRPFPLKNSNMVTMFNLFADLISYHLLSQDVLEAKEDLLKHTRLRLQDSMEDIRQFEQISRHHLQEPLRKMRIYSDKLIHHSDLPQDDKRNELALKISSLARDFSDMIGQLSDFTDLNGLSQQFQVVDLNEILFAVMSKLRLKIEDKKAIISADVLHTVYGIPQQISQLFYHLLGNALHFSGEGVSPIITLSSRELTKEELTKLDELNPSLRYCGISFSDNGPGIEGSQLESIFRLFSRLNTRSQGDGFGMGLPLVKKIVLNHRGAIRVRSTVGSGSVFTVVLPLHQ
jgi:signal transduction histidine kinase